AREARGRARSARQDAPERPGEAPRACRARAVAGGARRLGRARDASGERAAGCFGRIARGGAVTFRRASGAREEDVVDAHPGLESDRLRRHIAALEERLGMSPSSIDGESLAQLRLRAEDLERHLAYR